MRWGGILLLGTVTVLDVLWQFVTLIFAYRSAISPLFDDLLLAEAAPAAGVPAFVAWLLPHRPVLRPLARVLAGGLRFAWVTLEIPRHFHDKIGLFSGSTEAEWYPYSVAWLAFAGAVLAAGLIYRNEWLRRVGLIGVAFVIGKAFLSDMAELSGVLRALSFIGLGGALVGLGYAYRRFRPLQQASDPTAPATRVRVRVRIPPAPRPRSRHQLHNGPGAASLAVDDGQADKAQTARAARKLCGAAGPGGSGRSSTSQRNGPAVRRRLRAPLPAHSRRRSTPSGG